MRKKSLTEKSHNGFTFVEVMIVMALVSIVGLAIVSSLTMGMKVWRRATSPVFTHRKATLAFERLCVELRRLNNYPPIGFIGEKHSVVFANVAHGKIYNISYSFDPETASLVRQTVALRPATLFDGDGARTRSAIPDVGDMSFGYFGVVDNETHEMGFLDEWNYTSMGIPPIVLVSVTFANGNNTQRYVPIAIRY